MLNRRVILVLVICGSLTVPTLADMTVNWATGGAQLTQVGNWGYPSSPYDIITLDPGSGSLTLVPGTPVNVVVNGLTFQVGVNSSQPWTDTDVLTRDITVNGVTKSLALANPIDVVIASSDTLHVYAGDPVVFGNIIVTPLGWTTGLVNSGVTKISSVSASFELVETPIPAAVLLGMLGLGTAGLRLRRKSA